MASSTSAASPGPLKNLYHRRQVADTATRPCFICYKPTSTVLATPDARDFFYACPGHLADRGFAIPVATAAPADPSPPTEPKDDDDEAEMRREIDAVKAEYAAKQDKGDADTRTKERDAKIAEIEKKHKQKQKQKKKDKDKDDAAKAPTQDDNKPADHETARVFTLHRAIFAMRLAKQQAYQSSRRTADRLRAPNAFPAVPTKPL